MHMNNYNGIDQRQTQRFSIEKTFAIACLVFFCLQLVMLSMNSPSSMTPPCIKTTKSEEFVTENTLNGKASKTEKKMLSPFEDHPKLLKTTQQRPGEQLPFPEQPPPLSNTSVVEYAHIGVERLIDLEIVKRIKGHLKKLPHSLLDPYNKSKECQKNMTLAEYWMETKNISVPVQDSWERFYAQIGTCELYNDVNVVNDLLHDLSELPIKHVSIMDGGTQVKLLLTFNKDKQAVFKPMRYGRDYETDPNHFYFVDFERHNAEIATFHLDRILGFRKVPPTVGRVLNITSDLFEKADKKLKKTFFISPAKNYCFLSRCDYYCDTTHAICGSPDLKEGSVQVHLPDDRNIPRKTYRSPYKRTYSKRTQLAIWQTEMNYCETTVKTNKTYAHGRRLLDLIDLHIMDYLIGNQDRHHYEAFTAFEGITAYPIHLDNGRSFGKTDFDDDDILLPLRQCCLIRPSTLMTLFNFYSGPVSLTEALHKSISKDRVSPVLAFKHYSALERRMNKLMVYILECMDKTEVNSMVVNEFHNQKIPVQQTGMEEDDESEESSEDES